MGDVRTLWIEGPAGRLEAALRQACPSRGVAVLAHPHPLYGGTLHNPVLFHADRELNRAGWTTLRFNFRGVGSSEGIHDEGEGEREDVAAAVSWQRALACEQPLLLVGYSFGAWCAIRHALSDPGVAAVIALGLPVRHYAFDEIERLGRPLAVIQGSLDELGTPEEIAALLGRARPEGQLYVVAGASHLFPGLAGEAAAAVVEAATALFGPRPPDP